MNTLTDAVGRVAESARSVVQLEVQSALNDAKRKVAAVGIGIGVGLIALLLLGLSFLFGLAALTVELTHYMSVGKALLVMCLVIFAFAVIFAVIGFGAMRSGSKRQPAKPIGENAKDD